MADKASLQNIKPQAVTMADLLPLSDFHYEVSKQKALRKKPVRLSIQHGVTKQFAGFSESLVMLFARNVKRHESLKKECSKRHVVGRWNFYLYFPYLITGFGRNSARYTIQHLWVRENQLWESHTLITGVNKLHLLMYRETVWHFESKERLGEVCVNTSQGVLCKFSAR